MTTPATQALLPVTVEQVDREAAAKCMERDHRVTIAAAMRNGEIDKNWLIQAFARHRKAQSLPGDVGTAIDQAILWARDDKCSYPADAEKFDQRIEILRAALTPSACPTCGATTSGGNMFCSDGFHVPSALSGDAGEVWQPIETCPMWAVAVVTDGISVAISQRAEADDGTPYWAIDPEDGLDWEPTYWVPALDEHLPSHQGAGE